MKEIMKGKRNLASRIIAVLLSLVMVLSVLYVSNKDKEVSAEETLSESTTPIDCTAPKIKVSGTSSAETDTKEITLKFYGNVNVTFGLDNIVADSGTVTYEYNGTYYSTGNSSDMNKISLCADSQEATIDIYVANEVIADGSEVNPLVTLKLQYAGDKEALKNQLSKATAKYDITTQKLNIQTGLSTVKAGDTISFDTQTTEYVYGELLYGVTTESNGTVNDWQSDSAVTIGKSGNYYPHIQLKMNGTVVTETKVEKSPILCDSEPPTVSDISLQQGTDAKGTINGMSVSNAYIMDTYTVSFTSNEDGTVSLTKNGEATDVTNQQVEKDQNVTVAVPSAVSSDAGKTISYKLEVKDTSGNVALNLSEITISYLSGNTTISDVKVNDKSVTENEKVITKKNSDGNVVISADVSADIEIKSVKLFQKEAGTDNYKETSALQPSQNNQYTFTLNNLAEGSNDYRIEVENAYGEKYNFDFILVIDNTAPTLPTFTLQKTKNGETESVKQGETYTEKLSLNKIEDAKVTLPFSDATNISSLTVYSKVGSVTSEKQVINLNAKTIRSSETSPEIPLSKFHVGLSDEQIKGKEVEYHAIVQDEAENSKEYLLFTVAYYKDELTVSDVSIGNFKLNPIAGAQAAAATVVENFTHNEKTGTLTNAYSYNISFTVTSDVELEKSDITLYAGETALEQEPSTFTKTETDGTYTYTGSFILNEKYEGNTVTYKVQAKNSNDVTAEKEATILFIDITAPTATSTLQYEKENTLDSVTWYRNLIVVYSASDAPETKESIASGIEKLEVSQDNSDYAPVEEQDGNYPVIIKASDDKQGTDIRLRVTDHAGNVSYYPSETEFDTYHVDNAAPVGKLSVQDEKGNDLTNGGRLSGIPQITYSMSDDLYLKGNVTISYPNGSTVTAFTTEGDPWTEKTAQRTFSLKTVLEEAEQTMSDGTYTVTLSAEDTIGAITPVTFTFTIDNKPPEVTKIYVKENNAGSFTEYTLQAFQQYLNRPTCPEKLVIRIGAEDALGNVSNITVSQYGGAAQSFLGNTTGDIEITPSRDGNGTPVHVEVFDANENSNNKNSYDWSILVDSQVSKLNLAVKDPAYKDNDSVLKGDPVIAISDSDNIRITARNIEIQTPTSTIRRSDSSHLGTNKLSALLGRGAVDGKYVIRISATDPAGHRVEKMLSFTLDNTIPVNEMKIANAAPAKMNKYNRTSYDGTKYGQYYNANVTFNYSVTDTNIKNVTVWDNGNAVSRNPNGTVIISQEGSHTVSITSEDMAGNQGTMRSFTFVIDKTAPVINTTLNGSTYTNNSGIRYLRGNGTLTVTVNELNKDTDDLTRVERITPPSQSTQTNSAKIGEGTAVYQTEADYEVSFVAVDRAGNVSAERTVQFRVDKNAPELSISGIADGGTSTKSVTVTYGIQEAFYWDMTSAKINIYKGIDGQREKLLKTVDYNAKNANSRMSETFSEDGDYRFEFTAEDKAGNTAQKSYSFILDGTAPVVSLSGVKNYDKTKEKVTMEVTVTEDFFTSNELTLKGTLTDDAGKKQNLKFGAFSVNSSRVSNIVQQFTEDGVYDLEVTSKDKAGNTTTETLHFTIDNSAPALADLSAYDGTVMNEFVWNLSNDDVVNDLTVCDVVVYLDGTEYDGLNDVEDGKHVLRIVATDELGNTVEKQYEFLLDTIAPNVIITGAEDGGRLLESTDVGVSLQIDGDVLDSVTLNGENKAITDNACNFTVDRSGEYELLVKAHDGAGNTVEKMIHFEYGKKFNILWIILLILLLLLLAVVIILLVRKSKKDRA